jgi:transcriptional regulator with XRE-family HTH domain
MHGNSGIQENFINVGGRLRELRTERQLTIRSLAEMSGLNVNTLSLIENGKTSPSVSTLQQIAQALQVPISSFFESKTPKKKIVLQRNGLRRRAEILQGSLEDLGEGIPPGGGGALLVSLEPLADCGPTPIVHTGHEFVYCLEGELIYTIEQVEYPLGPGDSLAFEAHLPHHWKNPASSQTRWLLVLFPADENDNPTERHFSTQ